MPLEVLANLTFLTLNDAEHPDNVRFYAHMAEEQLNVLRELLFPPVGSWIIQYLSGPLVNATQNPAAKSSGNHSRGMPKLRS
jgi:hypothetical protein